MIYGLVCLSGKEMMELAQALLEALRSRQLYDFNQAERERKQKALLEAEKEERLQRLKTEAAKKGVATQDKRHVWPVLPVRESMHHMVVWDCRGVGLLQRFGAPVMLPPSRDLIMSPLTWRRPRSVPVSVSVFFSTCIITIEMSFSLMV